MIEKAVDSMDSKEVNGRRLRVRSAGDKEPRKPGEYKVKRELTLADVRRHLAFAFNEFLGREEEKEGVEEEKVEQLKQVKELIKNIFDLPDDDSLQV